MRFIKQKGFSFSDGAEGRLGCLSACVATVFGISLNDAPNPYTEWVKKSSPKRTAAGWKVVDKWFSKRGFKTMYSKYSGDVPEGYWIAIVPSRYSKNKNDTHAVIFKGSEFFFDPYPDYVRSYELDEVINIYSWKEK